MLRSIATVSISGTLPESSMLLRPRVIKASKSLKTICCIIPARRRIFAIWRPI